MKERILQYLSGSPNMKPATIASELQFEAASVRKALTILRRANKVVRHENGNYSLSEQPALASTSQSGN